MARDERVATRPVCLCLLQASWGGHVDASRGGRRMMKVQPFAWCWRPARDWCAQRTQCVCDGCSLMYGAAVARAIGGEARPAM
jgi:hypothetical protein